MRVLCVFGEHNYGDPNRGQSYEFANFVPALRALGHEVLFLESWNRACYRDFPELNRRLLDVVDRERPDVVFSVMFTYEIWLETWQLLRDAGFAATVNWTTDDSWKYKQSSRFLAPAFHAFTTTYLRAYSQYHQDGLHNVLLTQWAASGSSLQPPLPSAECQHRVSFVGTAHGNRPDLINALRQRGIEVECFGYGWPHGPVAADEIPAIIRSSVISLNFANSGVSWMGRALKRNNQLKARTFEVPGSGGFLLTETCEGIEEYYTPGKEIEIYNTIDELADKINWYLSHPEERDRIAQAGYWRTCSEHTYERRLADVLDFALAQRDKFLTNKNSMPVHTVDWDKFRSAEQLHRSNAGLELLRSVLVASSSAIWGPARGPRAARRLVFELSWRLFGVRTYSASGLPGRMFFVDDPLMKLKS